LVDEERTMNRKARDPYPERRRGSTPGVCPLQDGTEEEMEDEWREVDGGEAILRWEGDDQDDLI
jgi:hypothetical protein